MVIIMVRPPAYISQKIRTQNYFIWSGLKALTIEF